MNRRLLVTFLLLTFTLPALPAIAGTPAADTIDRLSLKHKALNMRSLELEVQGSALFARIKVIKQTDSKQRGILEDLELSRLLKEAVELSRQQDTIEKEKAETRTALVQALKDAIRELASKKQANPPDVERAAAWARMLRDLEGAPVRQPAMPEIKAAATDGPRDLADKADFLADSEDRIRREIKELKIRIMEAREDQSLKTESGHFMKEHLAFDDEYSRQVWSRTVDRPVSTDGTKGPSVSVGSDQGKGAPGYGNPGTPTQQVVITGASTQAVKGGPQPQAKQQSAEDEIAWLEASLAEMESLASDLAGRASTLRAEAEKLKKELLK